MDKGGKVLLAFIAIMGFASLYLIAEVQLPPDALQFFMRNNEAAELLKKIQADPKNFTLRLDLAKLYAENGNYVMKDFMMATADYLRLKQLKLPSEPLTRKDWLSCSGSMERLLEDRKKAEPVQNLLNESKDREAVETIEQVIKENGNSCELASEWAYAVVHSGTLYPSNNWTSWSSRELAMRWLIMVAERIKHFPQFRPGEAPVYESLAFYFDANRDYVSAYFCVSMAIHWANHGGSGVLDSKAFVEEMAKRREKLRRLIEFEGAK